MTNKYLMLLVVMLLITIDLIVFYSAIDKSKQFKTLKKK
ncbi:hypothetical protein HMPREF9281_01732 [Staphylococcus epidermidis BVS058A4]|nr:hypothetical protein HMPREF9281_01732 [Staphylococcus epidermidis BVS058A4]